MHQQIQQRRQPDSARDMLIWPLERVGNVVRRVINVNTVIPFLPQYNLARVIGGDNQKKPAYSGPATKEKAKAAASAGTGAGATAAPDGAGGDGAGGDDGDGGDGDGDGDGPRRSTSSRLPARRSPPRAPRRQFLPRLLTRYAFAWLLALALMLGFLALPALAILAAQLGHPTLASEILHFKPVWLLPIGAGVLIGEAMSRR